MDRVFESGALGTPPSAPASPSTGYATAGNPGSSTPATKPGPWWFHQVTEELRHVIASAGLTPDHETLTQLKQAMDLLYGSSGGQIQPITASVAANALTLTLNPTSLDFRSATLSSGVINSRDIGSAISCVVPSGATLGTINAQAARLVLLAIDNGGTVELAVVNLAGGLNLDETTLISTTALSAAADAANVVYSTTARSNVPFRVVGFIDITEATAGTWATAASTIQGCGGQALTAMSSIGYGQTWQNVTGSRAIGTTYYNTTGKPIQVSLLAYNTTLGSYMAILVNGVIAAEAQQQATYYSAFLTAIVPPGASYQHTNAGAGGAFPFWSELR